MRIGSLFAGYGGLDLGLSMIIDAEPVWFVEFDKHPSAVLARRYPDVPNHGDVTSVDWAAVEPVDILTGGFPCQDVSHAGLRRGIKPGTRSGLWEHFAYAIKALRPGLVVIENVSGILSADAHCDVEPCPWCVGDEPAGHMRALGAVLADLAEAGFDAEWCSVRASDAGAPHRRERVFIVAADATRERHDGAGDAGPRRWAEPTDRGADPDVTLLPTPAVNDMGRGKTPEDWDDWTQSMRAKHGNGNGHGKSLEIEAQRLLPTPTARDWKDGATNPDAVPVNGLLDRAVWHDFGPYTAAIHRWEQVLGRPAPSPTEPGRDGRQRLSPRFVEWMMGLPAGHVTGVGIPRNAQLKALGNGVVPAQAALALSMLLPRLYGGEAGAVAVADDVRLLPTPTASLAGGEPAPWKPGVQWWRQSRATRNLAGIVTGNTPEWEGGST